MACSNWLLRLHFFSLLTIVDSSSSPALTPPSPPPSPPPTTSPATQPDKREYSPTLSLRSVEGTSSSVATSGTESPSEPFTGSRDSQIDGAELKCTPEEFTPPLRKIARFTLAAEPSGPTSKPAPAAEAALQLLPPPYPRFDDMPFEILAHILRLCFEDVESLEEYVEALREVYWLGRRPRDVINNLSELWTKVHPVSPTAFTEYSLQRSLPQAVSVSYNPKPEDLAESASSRKQWQDLPKFLRLFQT
ncbi:hypothetical protein FS837_002256 [Tulasnella sp. UAMH 9824]|nr:hypothetical protein FS837_002256 [Tulasnella sp. UAMH 9824]